MNIREARMEDLDIIVQYNYNLAFETEDKELNKDILKSGVENLLKDHTKGKYYICEIEGKVIGQMMTTYEWSDWRNGTFLWIQSVYVHKEFRSKGVFKALYNNVKEIAESTEGICGLRLYVEFENSVAQKTYSSLGMERCHYYMYEQEIKK